MEAHDLVQLKPLDRLVCDFMEHQGRNFHVVCDAGSGFLWVKETPTKGTQQAVNHVKEIMNVFGRALQCSTDRGPAYRDAWAAAMTELGVDVHHGATYHPQSQGAGERAVGRVKELLVCNGMTGAQQLDEVVHVLNFNGSTAAGKIGRAHV